MNNISLEVCVTNYLSALEAERGGADRIELCENIADGGTTPSAGMIEQVCEQLSIDVHVMIRPRGGDFCYSTNELTIMMRDIDTAKQLGADGVVFGILKPDGTINLEANLELIEQAKPLKVTFHRAFDMVKDPYQSLDDLITLKVDYLLTSGLQNKAIDGLNLIAELVIQADGRLRIMVGSGVNEDNIAEIIQKSQALDYHVSCRKLVESVMQYRNPNVSMSGSDASAEYTLAVTDAERIRNVVDQIRNVEIKT